MMTLMRMLIACLIAAATTCAHAQSGRDESRGMNRAPPFNEELRIVGGEVVSSVNAWPWQIALYRLNGGKMSFLCGGSVIAQKWVLTAAHCIKDASRAGDYAVVEHATQIDFVLDGNAQHGGRRLAVRRIVVHEQYDAAKSENDIALIELATPSQTTPVPYGVAQASGSEATGKNAVVTGWGQLREIKEDEQGRPLDAVSGQTITPENWNQYIDDKLRQVELPLVDIDSCKTAYANSRKSIDARTLCAGVAQGGRDSCQGDSGGPLVARDEKKFFVQIGVVSWGNGCGRPGFPGVYTRVSAFETWLADKTGIRQDRPSPDSQSVADALAAIGNPAGVSVGIAPGSRLRIGEKVQFRATTKQAGYLLLLDVSSNGTVTQIFPNEASLRSQTGQLPNANRVDPGRPRLVPNLSNPYEGFGRFEVEGPAGQGLLVGVLSKQPMTWLNTPQQPRSFESRSDALGYLATLGRVLDRGVVVEGKGAPDVSVATTSYTIIP